jgi:putative transposase
MPDYIRAEIPGGTFFFTVVTYDRERFLYHTDNVELLSNAFREIREQKPFTLDAYVILPDHLHCIWTLPEGDSDFSNRWRLIKTYFSHRYSGSYSAPISPSREKKHEKAVWQRRFWEHWIRDQVDYKNHLDYIHYNPVKHGLVSSPRDWKYSSFRRFVREGVYELDWGSQELPVFFGIGHE